MKFSLNLAQHYSNVDLKSLAKDELLKRIGAQLGAVEDVTDWSLKYEGAVIVKVVSCEKHPNADKLSVCQVDDGSGKTTQVVCGAPNVRAGMFAVWLKPGVTVPNSRDKDPFVLDAREIRGVVSNGMLASASELGISEDHSGILEVDPKEVEREPKPGEPLTNFYGLDDFIIDCENKMFTHRPDCFGNLGIAREVAGIFDLQFKSPDWYLNVPKFETKNDLPLVVSNEAPDLVPRFMAVALKNITVKPSPVWLQAFLTRIGIKSINNVVDVTNFVMHLTGQPLHAFDYDKLIARSNSPSLMPRKSIKGEKLMLLGQKEIELTGEEVVIATDKQAIGLAGIMGGADTEVGENTKNIVIECATFDMYAIRRTSMKYGLFTDAATRYTKGQSPLQNDRVLWYAIKNMAEEAGAIQASDVFDEKAPLTEQNSIKTKLEFINERLGSSLNKEDISRLLKNVEFNISIDEAITIHPPFWRMDIEQSEDIVEEIGRLHGYDMLPVKLPPRIAKPTPKNGLLEFRKKLREMLVKTGANELLTYSFVHGDLLRKTGTDPDKWAFHLRNALSPDLQYYRTALVPSLLAKVHPNIKAQAGSAENIFAIYEIGKVHVKGDNDKEGLPTQHQRLALVVSADDKTAKNKGSGAAFYLAKKYLDLLTGGKALISGLENEEYPIAALYQKGRSGLASINGEVMGVIGEFKPEVQAALKLPVFTAGFELDLELLKACLKPRIYTPLPEYPGTDQDITFETLENIQWAELTNSVKAAADELSQEHGITTSISPGAIYRQSESEPIRISYHFVLHHPARTLTTAETSLLLDSLTSVLAAKHKVQRV